jgi:hypothetical protein
MLAEAREIGDPDAIAHAQLGLAPISYEWNELDAAQREAEAALGYARFGAQGQDIGAAVTIRLGADHADVVAGIHLPGVLAFPPQDRPLSAEGQAFLARQERWRSGEGGYAHQQGTYPQTLACGLTDSPTGLAAWIVDKFRAWSDCDGDLERCFSKDEVLTHLTIYGATGYINSSFLFYYERRHVRAPARSPAPVRGARGRAGRRGALPEGKPGHRPARVG